MRLKPITITLLVAVLHRITVWVCIIFGYGWSMSAFNGKSSLVGWGHLLFRFSELLDLPVFALRYLAFRLKHGVFPSTGMFRDYQNELPASFLWTLVWSLCVGVIVGVLVALYRRRKYGPQKPRYW